MPMIPERGFPEAEYVMRTAKAQAAMARDGLAGLLLTTEPEMRYFSGFHTLFWQSPTRPWFLFVPATGKPVAVIPEIGAELMRGTWIEDIRTWSAPAPDDDGISLLTELLAPHASRREVVGLMKGHETHLRMPLNDYERLLAGLGDLSISDATGLIRGLRMVKSEREIEKIGYACAIASRSFARLPDLAYQGQPLEDVFRAFRREMLGQGADDIPYLVGGADTGGYRDVISPPSRRPLTRGDILMLDTGSTWDGYFCDFDRNWAIGSADDASRRAYDVLWRATEAGIAAARPGTTCRDIFQAMQGVIAEMDDQGGDVGRLGHGLGMQLTEWPSHAAWDSTEIVENMVLTLEPSLGYGDGRIMVHEENIVIRKAGAELLTERAAAELPII
ncbi:Xaa-Pro peptidase family protein [Ruegeria sp. PrR005]|uniref:Aminopeptidase P family protein n=1 Tax=Ruegeria sp. PrR005 TaxID=2706882 RepID=A0A6B2NNH3_9RHOB|nr:Xaa-Pro peptidase family protein [Ruegeria sp. PrR005]NDW45666.1 aminopeptidase P family protein [Ruegeria sp. PrR005]